MDLSTKKTIIINGEIIPITLAEITSEQASAANIAFLNVALSKKLTEK